MNLFMTLYNYCSCLTYNYQKNSLNNIIFPFEAVKVYLIIALSQSQDSQLTSRMQSKVLIFVQRLINLPIHWKVNKEYLNLFETINKPCIQVLFGTQSVIMSFIMYQRYQVHASQSKQPLRS